MDLNLSVIAGRLAAEPELRMLESGSRFVKILVTVRSQEPRKRIDVIPVSMWDPDDDVVDSLYQSKGKPVWVAGSLQRRFWSADTGSTSRLEFVAHSISVREETSKP